MGPRSSSSTAGRATSPPGKDRFRRSASIHRVITMDLPGHGKSDLPKDGKFSMEQFARAVEAVRAEAKVERAVLVGHSMGTPVIRMYALIYPARVAGLVLVDGLVQVAGAAPPFTPPPMLGKEGLQAREKMVRGMFGPATTPPLQEHILKMMLGTKEATAAGAMTATWTVVGQERSDHRARARRVCGKAASRARRDLPHLPEGRVPRDSRLGALPDDGEAGRVQSAAERVPAKGLSVDRKTTSGTVATVRRTQRR